MGEPDQDDLFPVELTDDGHIDGQPPERVVRTHVGELWFGAEHVYKRKRPVDMGFLDFTTLEAREAACRRELALNRRLARDVYLGLAAVRDRDGELVDWAVVLRRLPGDRRLARLVEADDEAAGCLRDAARQLAVFHTRQEPLERDEAREFAGPAVLEEDWGDNLEALADHPELVDGELVRHIHEDAHHYLAGRSELIEARIGGGLVRDGHGDLLAEDIFCLDDGPRILDCLEFSDRYRIGDVLLDVAFLAMDLERLGRPDLAGAFLHHYTEFTAEHHPDSLAHHFVAYRASVRAKVACLRSEQDDDEQASVEAAERASELAEMCARHLSDGRVRLVVVGGLPGTGKSTLAAGIAEDRGWLLLRSDEIRKDLAKLGHQQRGGQGLYRPWMTMATYAEMLDRGRQVLRRGESVVLDASWADADHRDQARGVARQTHSQLIELRCTAPAELARQRLVSRTGDASDAGPEVHRRMAGRFDDWPSATPVATTGTPEASLEAGLQALGEPATARR